LRVEIREACEADIAAILADIREADVTEMAALGITPEIAMADGLKRSDWAMTGLLDGVPVCMFGVAPRSIILGEGVPWMLAANGLERAQVKFLKTCRPAVNLMRASYPKLMNFVHADNSVTIKWLRWLGFAFAPPNWPEDAEPPRYTINGHPFLLFSIGF
jgi:hypothetical protein